MQARDKETGLPVWPVDVMDFDPEARETAVQGEDRRPGAAGAAGGGGRSRRCGRWYWRG